MSGFQAATKAIHSYRDLFREFMPGNRFSEIGCRVTVQPINVHACKEHHIQHTYWGCKLHAKGSQQYFHFIFTHISDENNYTSVRYLFICFKTLKDFVIFNSCLNWCLGNSCEFSYWSSSGLKEAEVGPLS